RMTRDAGSGTNVAYGLALPEGGSWAVASASSGKALFDSRFEGSGWVPLHQLDLGTNTITLRRDDPGSGGSGQVRQDTPIRRGADRSLLFLMESDISSRPTFTYHPASDPFPRPLDTQGFF